MVLGRRPRNSIFAYVSGLPRFSSFASGRAWTSLARYKAHGQSGIPGLFEASASRHSKPMPAQSQDDRAKPLLLLVVRCDGADSVEKKYIRTYVGTPRFRYDSRWRVQDKSKVLLIYINLFGRQRRSAQKFFALAPLVRVTELLDFRSCLRPCGSGGSRP